LEIWRPYFFLTDDNLAVGLPFLTEMGRHLKSGQSPFYSDYLFGGHYDLLRDINFFCWSPLNFAVSLLADTPGRFLMIDLFAFANFLLTTAGFVLLGTTLRSDLQLEISDGRLLFYTLSFVFSTFIITCGASWANFLVNQAVLPWLALGLWVRSWRPALAILTLFSLHEALGGQSAATISSGLVFTLVAVLLSLHRRSLQPLLLWAMANGITLVVISPLLIPALQGFQHSTRSAGLSLELLGRFAMPAPLVPVSFLFGNMFGMAAWFAGIHRPYLIPFPCLPTLMACAAAWCVFPTVLNRRPWTRLEGGCAGIVLLFLLLVIRPVWITNVMAHVPIFRSMRWPFREILQLLFFLHVLLVLRKPAGGEMFANRVACLSFALFAVPLFFNWPFSLNPLPPDRQAVFSGQGERFWTAVKRQLRPGDKIATVLDPDLWLHSEYKMPYSLTGTGNFPAYYRVPTISGYSQTSPLDQLPIPVRPYHWFGAYAPDQLTAINKNHPEVRVITVKKISPLTLELSGIDGGAPVDLTPLLSR
jgi:hypothetical protein